MNIRIVIFVICISFVLEVRGKPPSHQPDCAHTPRAYDFYRAHTPPKKEEQGSNIVCTQKFKSKLKMCIGVYKLMVNRDFNTSYEMKNEKDKHTVATDCEKKNVTFYRSRFENSTDVDADGLATLEVDMFQCPISKMDIKFKFSWWIFSPKKRDFYITQGYGPSSVAVLEDASRQRNICVVNMFRPKSKS